jgi:hypothetical protein
MGKLFEEKDVKVDFINHLDQAGFVYESMQKPVLEMSKEELENAFMLEKQLVEFWQIQYNTAQKNFDNLFLSYQKTIRELET